MSQKFIFLVLLVVAVYSSSAQDTNRDYRNFPIVISIQFHSLTMPFKNLKSNFSNIGIGIGTEVSHNGRNNWVQEFQLVWYNNKEAGNGLLLYTQASWRPEIVSDFYTGLNVGVGYLIGHRPTESYKLTKGNWTSTGKKGKGMFTIPVGIKAGFHKYDEDTYATPFGAYQLLLVKNYNQSIPTVPMTLLQLGTGIHPNY